MATTITSRVGGLPIASPAEVQQAKSYAEIARQHAESAESSADAAAESEAAAAASETSAANSAESAADSAAVAAAAAASAVEVTGALPRVNRTALKALDTSEITTAYLTEDGREGFFRWRTGDYSAHVAADTAEGVYLKADAVAATSGAWERVYEGAVHIEWFGGAADDSTLNAALANVALNVLDVLGGGELTFSQPGTYLLEETGAHPLRSGHRQCIYIPGDNTKITIPNSSTTLKLADGQQTDANGPVHIISWSNDRHNITIEGLGLITGNTAGQTGWSGGYAQSNNGCIILSYGNGTPENYYIGRLRLEDHWSNPIDLGVGMNVGRGKRAIIDRVSCRNCGEGPQVSRFDGVDFLECEYILDADITMAGDQMEISECTDFRFINPRIVIEDGTPAGAAIDIFGSKHGLITGFHIDGADGAFGVTTTGGGITVDDVLVCDGVIRNLVGSNCLAFAEGRLVYSNIDVIDCNGTLFQMTEDDNPVPVELYNVRGNNCSFALITGNRKVIWHGGGNINSTSVGVSLSQGSSGETRNIDFDDLDFSGAASSEVLFNAAGFGPQYITGRMSRITLSAANKFGATNDDDLSGLVVEGVTPTHAGTINTSQIVTDIGLITSFCRSANPLRTFVNYSKNQRIMIIATGAWNLIDETDEDGVDIYLGGENITLAAGNVITLQHFTTADGVAADGWYIVGKNF